MISEEMLARLLAISNTPLYQLSGMTVEVMMEHLRDLSPEDQEAYIATGERIASGDNCLVFGPDGVDYRGDPNSPVGQLAEIYQAEDDDRLTPLEDTRANKAAEAYVQTYEAFCRDHSIQPSDIIAIAISKGQGQALLFNNMEAYYRTNTFLDSANPGDILEDTTAVCLINAYTNEVFINPKIHPELNTQ